MKNKFIYIPLLLIVFLGVFLRFYKLQTNFIFGRDQSEDIYKLVSIYQSFKNKDLKSLPLIGEPATYVMNQSLEHGSYPVYTGVFFLYFILPAALIVSFNPHGLTLFFAVANAFSIFTIYLLGRELVDKKTGLIAAFLFSSSYLMNVYSRAIWTPSLVPLFVILGLYLLVVIKNKAKTSYWPILLFVISGVSQIHDSGYYYLFFFLALILFLRPKPPSSIASITTSLFAFLLPILPTIVYELRTGFRLIPSLMSAFMYQFNASGLMTDVILTKIVPDTFFKFWQFWISVYPNYYRPQNAIFAWLVACVMASVLIAVFYMTSVAKKIFLVFLITFFSVPYFASIYYSDSFLGLMPLSGTTFSVLGAIPILILCLSILLSRLYGRGGFWVILATVFMVSVCFANIKRVQNDIWNNGEHKFDFSEKLEIVEFIGRNVESRKYSLQYKNVQNEGQEFLYLFDYKKIEKPVSFNGTSFVLTAFYKYTLTQGEPEISYSIFNKYDSIESYCTTCGEMVMETESYRVYKLNLKV